MKKIDLQTYIQIGIFTIFFLLCLGFVFSKGICCGDDAKHAEVAKNLSLGLGYASTTQEALLSYSVKLFDPRIGVGPSIILPAAVFIRVFGNTTWAPGFAFILLTFVILLIIGYLIRYILGSSKIITLGIFLFFSLSYLLFTYHFEQWYALLGEIPAALLIILAVQLFVIFQNKFSHFFVGIIFSLACNAKLISFIGFFIFLLLLNLIFIFNDVKNKQSFGKQVQKLFWVMLGFITPFITFEIWKLFSLGSLDYFSYWANYKNYIFELGVKQSTAKETIIIVKRFYLLFERFGIILPLLFPLLIIVGFLLKGEEKLYKIYIYLTAILCGFIIYWVFLSIGWARYFVIPLILIIFILVLPVFSSSKRSVLRISYYLIMVCFLLNSFTHIEYPFENLHARLFSPSPNVLALREVKQILSESNDGKIVTQYWGTSTDIEYILDTYQNFTTYRDPTFNPTSEFRVAFNQKFLVLPDDKFDQIMSHCNMTNIGEYIIGQCGP